MAVTKESVTNAYRRYARYYDFIFGSIFHPGRQTAIEHLHCLPGDRILEVGVGTGLSLGLYPPGVKVVGIDLSKEMLDRARHRVAHEGYEHVEDLVQMDAQDMDFPDHSFDKVVAMYVASVVPSPKTFVQEVKRVCKPGGMIIILNHFQNRSPLVQKVENWLQPFARQLGFHPQFPLEEFVAETGFKVSTSIPVNLMNHWTVLVGFNDQNDNAPSKSQGDDRVSSEST